MLAHKQAVGRVILMGNAAHTIHPVAGQGFNLCLRDADVLLRYLVNQLSASDDIGNPDNLLAYEQARLSDQQRVIKFCDTVVRGFSNQNPLLKLIRNTGLIAFDVIRCEATGSKLCNGVKSMSEVLDVVIVGGGLVGGLTALLLAQGGVQATVLDAALYLMLKNIKRDEPACFST